MSSLFKDLHKYAQQQRATNASEREKRLAAQQNMFNVPQFGQQYDRFSQTADRAQHRVAPQAAESQFRGYQDNLLRQLQADAAGRGPGQQLVRMQAQGMADRGAAQQMAMASGARPGQTASAGRNAAFNAANMQSAVGGQAAQAGLAARLGAMQQMGQASTAARGQDLQRGQFNADMNLRQMGLNDATELQALQQRLGLTGMQQQGMMSLEQMRTQAQMAQKAQPKWWERGIGAAAGAAEIYANMQTGGAPAAAKAASGGGGSLNTSFNPGSSPGFGDAGQLTPPGGYPYPRY